MKQIYLNWVDVTVYEDWTFDVSNTFYQDGYLRTFSKESTRWIKTKRWYYYLNLSKKKFYAHRVIAAAYLWLDIEDKKVVVRHLDGDWFNNRLSNLAIWNQKDNCMDTVRMNKVRNQSWWQLVDHIVHSICKDLINWIPWNVVAKKHNLTTTQVSGIKLWYTYVHITLQYPEMKKFNFAQKLSINDVIAIKTLKRDDKDIKSKVVADMYWTHPSTISDIWNGRRYNEVKVEWFLEKKKRNTTPLSPKVLEEWIKLIKLHWIKKASNILWVCRHKLARAIKKNLLH